MKTINVMVQLSISEMNKSSKFREHFDFFYMHSEV